MKKILAIVLTLSIMGTSGITALAARGSEQYEVNACAHKSYTSMYYYTYTYLSDDYHEVYRTERRRCNSCGDIFYQGNPDMLAAEAHTFKKVNHTEVHTGDDPKEHYYTNEYSCTVCKYQYVEKVATGCRGGQCNFFNRVVPEPM